LAFFAVIGSYVLAECFRTQVCVFLKEANFELECISNYATTLSDGKNSRDARVYHTVYQWVVGRVRPGIPPGILSNIPRHEGLDI